MEQNITQNQNLKSELIFQKNNFNFLNSGKLGLSLIFEYLKEEKNFNPKFDEVFVPKFMGNWIYSSLNQKCVTSPTLSLNTKVIYMYHQFGIPQKYQEIKDFADENKLILLEDCAHVLSGKDDNDNLIGELGDYTIFSLSKFINCYLLGGVTSKDENFNLFIKDQINKSSKIQSYINYFMIRFAYSLNENSILRKKLFNINYSLYNFPSKNLNFVINKFKKNIKREIDLRKIRYNQLRDMFKENILFDYLKCKDLIIFKAPIITEKNNHNKIIENFNKNNLTYEILNYDINRNILNSKYNPTILIPIGSENPSFNQQLKIIKDIIDE